MFVYENETRFRRRFEMAFFKKLDRRKFFVLIFIGVLIDFTACVPQNNQPTTNANVNPNPVNTSVNTNIAKPPENRQASLSMPVTLPVLDAMFSDEQFAGELKSKLQLSDEQIQKLKQVSGESVQNLSDDETDNNSGSTRAETERANNEIRQILGEEKASGFFELVRRRWEGGENGTGANTTTAAAKPNAPPTDTRIVVNAPAYRMD